MEFTVKRFDLLQELALIQGVVERKTTIPILANVLVRAEEDRLAIARASGDNFQTEPESEENPPLDFDVPQS